MKKRLVIIGAGGHGKVCANVALRMNQWKDIVFLDDHQNDDVLGFRVVGPIDVSLISDQDDTFVAIGDNKKRSQLIEILLEHHHKLVTLIDPSALTGLKVKIGLGTLIMPKAVINADTIIGQGVIINTASIVEHDCIIGNYVHVSPNASLGGNVQVGDLSWVGIGSCIIHSVRVTDNVIIGAGSVVIKDTLDSGTYAGCPVQKIH